MVIGGCHYIMQHSVGVNLGPMTVSSASTALKNPSIIFGGSATVDRHREDTTYVRDYREGGPGF